MFVTTCDKGYLIGLEVMLKSLVDANPRVKNDNVEFVVISNELAESDLNFCRHLHQNIKIKRYDVSDYASIPSQDGERRFGDYSKFEAFRMEAERVIFLDCDTLVMGNIDRLMDFEGGMAASRDLYIDQYNTGVMVLGKSVLSEKIFRDLVSLASIYGRTEHMDQDIINKYLYDEIEEIPISYNFLKTYHKPLFRNSELASHIKVLHYIVKKPWQNIAPVALEDGTLWLERYWFDVYAKVLREKSRHQSSTLSSVP